MALSIVSWRGENNGQQEFDVEIGSNQFYAWGIGSGTTKYDGVRMLSSRTRTSPLLGPLLPGSRGRALLRVPSDAFDEDHHHLQLLSFRDEELRGPAASDVIEVPWHWRPRAEWEDEQMTVMALSRPSTVMRPVPAPVPMSEAQFLDVLGGVISKVLPIVRQALPVVEQIGRAISGGPATGAPQQPAAAPAGGGAATPPSSPPGTPAITPRSGQPDLAQLLTQLIRQVEQAAAATPGTATGPSVGSGAMSARYAYASVAPLLAALPALAPLLQNLLTPQTVQSLISAADPNKLLQTTLNGIMDAARIGQAATDALHAHLRALNPGLGDDVLIPLLASMSTTASANERSPRRTISRIVRLELPDLAPVDLGGYPQVAFRHGDDITLPLSVDTPRAIPKPRLRVCLKEADTSRRVAERTWTFDRLEPGRPPESLVLPGSVTSRLEPGREYVVGITLEWPGQNGRVGATTSQLIRIIGGALFDSLDTGGPPLRLDDVERDRSWWHKVWVDDIAESSRRTKARLDYEFRLLPGATANRRTRTSTDLTEMTDRRAEGTLRAGLGVSVAELSRLAGRLDGEPFDEAAVNALDCPEFAAAFDRKATCVLDLHARRGGQVAVWVWPEVKLHSAFLMVPGEVSPQTGQVLSFETRPVKVPVPGLAHVITTRSA